MPRTKYLLTLPFVFILLNGRGQNVPASSNFKKVFDTIPASIAVYKAKEATSVLTVIRGYVIYWNVEISSHYPTATTSGSLDSLMTLIEYPHSPELLKYLGVEKKPLNDSLGVWQAIPERESILQPPRGL